MHFYFLTRGNIDEVNEFAKWLSTRSFPLNFTDKDGVKKQVPLSAGLRPIQLWEYVAPETSKDEIMNYLRFDQKDYMTAKNKLMIAGLRKALGAKKPPKYKKDKTILCKQFPNVHIAPVGIKPDILDWKAPDGKTHERI